MNITFCERCGGMTRISLPAIPYGYITLPLPAGPINTCHGHPEPAPKYDGKLDKDGDAKVQYGATYPGEQGIYVIDTTDDDSVYLNPKQALLLLTWLEQERATLEQLAKEQS